ncbi:glycosyltransferase [Microvirga terrae]|uniref:Glycosyltransferase n=1 Tax=Microvirga terrae TaxID=2740529 RepID=A0ABY5RSL8_9HYPH|nr:glycosyltransferase [Microvirga terrae]UVF20250.1 glycosyltransferase [Microvirga terrae]
MKFVYFTHSLASCWNHGNAHFLRGVLRELVHGGHAVAVYEPRGAWSLENLLKDHGEAGLDSYRRLYPELSSRIFNQDLNLEEALADADVVIVHEWNEPWLVAAIGKVRRLGGQFTLLFHDTHHRAVSDPDAIRQFDLDGYDGVLAFGETLAEVYRRWGWGDRVHVWHEAADTRLFHPPAREVERNGLVWIGNWGDGERSAELESFLFRPAQAVGLPLEIYGVRYPDEALRTLARYGVTYRGWLPNARAPEVFSRHVATVHVPRRFYVEMLPGIPTIRVFEALACGIPLISAPWHDSEGLFNPGSDFLVAENDARMERHMKAVLHDSDLRRSLVENGLNAIRSRHSCAHRAEQLLSILADHGAATPMEMSA